MTKLLVTVLTSGKPEKLKRCLRSVNSNSSPHERIVVINTTDPDFTSQATQIAFDHGFPVRVTESNGTPGRGKNSVLQNFLETDADWLLPIDGDDYISGGCISRLHHEIENNDFDIGCLVGGRAIRPSGKIIGLDKIELLPKVVRAASEWKQSDVDYYIGYKNFITKKHFNDEPFNRMILLNRNVARHRFNEMIDIAEDILFFIQSLKDFKIHPIDTHIDDYIYMYDFSEDGAVMNAIKNKKLLTNIKSMMAEYDDNE